MIKSSLMIMTISAALSINAQVPVRDEPRHHNIFENELVRILDVHFGPGDTTLYHIHSTPSVFYTFTRTATASQLMGRPPGRSSFSRTGPPSYDSLGTPRIHRVWNEDTTWFHVMDIELTGGTPRSNQPVLRHPSLTLAFNRFLANGYAVRLMPGEQLELPATSTGYLLVSQGNADIQYLSGKMKQRRLMKAGHYIWTEAESPFFINVSGSPATLMLLQLK